MRQDRLDARGRLHQAQRVRQAHDLSGMQVAHRRFERGSRDCRRPRPEARWSSRSRVIPAAHDDRRRSRPTAPPPHSPHPAARVADAVARRRSPRRPARWRCRHRAAREHSRVPGEGRATPRRGSGTLIERTLPQSDEAAATAIFTELDQLGAWTAGPRNPNEGRSAAGHLPPRFRLWIWAAAASAPRVVLLLVGVHCLAIRPEAGIDVDRRPSRPRSQRSIGLNRNQRPSSRGKFYGRPRLAGISSCATGANAGLAPCGRAGTRAPGSSPAQ